MGFISWLQSLRSKNHTDPAPSTSTYQRANRTSTFNNTHAPSDRKSAPTSATRHQDDVDQKNDRRRSRGFSLSRPKSTHGSNRRSWFGGRPDVDEDVPEVPKIARDIPLSEFPSGYASQSSRPANNRKSSNRNHDGRGPVEALPSLPAMPVTAGQATQPATSTLPSDRRKSRRTSTHTLQRQPSMSSIKSKRRSRSSFWKSSNPDDSESDVPPVPALYRGESSESVRQHTSEESLRVSRHPTRTEESSKKPRPVSVVSTASRKSYRPKSAAKGFLNSTNGASEDQRKSFRKSFNMEDGMDKMDMVCLTEEQRIEWAKLMNGDIKLGDLNRPLAASETANSDQPGDRKFSNSQALAALEFGTAR